MALAARFLSRAADRSRYYAGWTKRLSGDFTAYHSKDGEISYMLAQPYGFLGAIVT
jgi:aldehyde dehydrogenase (NAD+)